MRDGDEVSGGSGRHGCGEKGGDSAGDDKSDIGNEKNKLQPLKSPLEPSISYALPSSQIFRKRYIWLCKETPGPFLFRVDLCGRVIR